MSNASKVTCRILEAMDEEVLSPKGMAEMALSWIGEDGVREMLRANDLLDFLEDEEDGSDDDDIDDDDWFEEELISREICNPGSFPGLTDENGVAHEWVPGEQFPWLTDDDVD